MIDLERKECKHITYLLNEIKFGDCFILSDGTEDILIKIKYGDITKGYNLCYNFNKNTTMLLSDNNVCYKIKNAKLIYEF